VARGWDSAYAGAPPPWDIGRPQPIVERIAERGGFRGRVLDAGCGTGENALYLASRGLTVLGADWSERAIAMAKAKAAERGVAAEFVVADALDLGSVGGPFDSALDSGLFHTFDDDDRARYVDGLAGVMRSGGLLHLLCFSDREPWGGGPRRVSQQEIRDSFAKGWGITDIEPFRFEARIPGNGGAEAWHAAIERA
jgi:cyclopropane fatty-acyl-phospholipid synthase-like methyltransferase